MTPSDPSNPGPFSGGQARQRDLFLIFSFLGICFINFLVFYPSVFHAARSDQVTYLIETAPLKTLPEVLQYSHTYAWNRAIDQGDGFLFRPVFLFVLGLERWYFGLNFAYWQALQILLHLLVVLQLLRVLAMIRPNILAPLCVLAFSVLYLSQEMVIWHHVGGYLVFLILLLEAFYQLVCYLKEESFRFRRIWIIMTVLTLASFTYELGVLASLLFGVVIYLYSGNRFSWKFSKEQIANSRAWLMMIPALMYVFLYVVDYLSSGRNTPLGSGHGLNVTGALTCFFSILKVALLGPFLPGFLNIEQASRLALSQDHWLVFSHTGWSHLNLVLVAGLIIWILMAWGKRNPASPKPADSLGVNALSGRQALVVGWTAFGVVLAHVLLLTVRSLFYQHDVYQWHSLYIFYITGVLLTITAYCLLSLCREKLAGRWNVFKVAMIVLLCVLTLLNAVKTHETNVALKNLHNNWAYFILRLERFVNAHKNESGFSFDLIWQKEVRIVAFTVGRPGQGKAVQGPAHEFLFSPYIKKNQPKYYLVYAQHEGVLPFATREQADQYLAGMTDQERTQTLVSF